MNRRYYAKAKKIKTSYLLNTIQSMLYFEYFVHITYFTYYVHCVQISHKCLINKLYSIANVICLYRILIIIRVTSVRQVIKRVIHVRTNWNYKSGNDAGKRPKKKNVTLATSRKEIFALFKKFLHVSTVETFVCIFRAKRSIKKPQRGGRTRPRRVNASRSMFYKR